MGIAWRMDELVPHSGQMRLLDEVVDANELQLVARATVRDDGLFNDVALQGAVPGWVGLEYMAQAAAAHVGFLRRSRGLPIQAGVLLGTRLLTCSADAFAIGSALTVQVERLFEASKGLVVYDCRVDAGPVVARAKINVFLPEGDSPFWSQVKEGP